jgi:hypothetical protein
MSDSLQELREPAWTAFAAIQLCKAMETAFARWKVQTSSPIPIDIGTTEVLVSAILTCKDQAEDKKVRLILKHWIHGVRLPVLYLAYFTSVLRHPDFPRILGRLLGRVMGAARAQLEYAKGTSVRTRGWQDVYLLQAPVARNLIQFSLGRFRPALSSKANRILQCHSTCTGHCTHG